MIGLARSWRLLASACIVLAPMAAAAQQLDLSHGGPVDITARDGIDWRQAEQIVVAHGDARATRGNVTVTADTLTAWYRKKAGAGAPAGTPAGLPGTPDTGGTEVYKLQAAGNVRITTPTDQAQGDRAVYEIDQAVLVMTGHDLRLSTPTQLLTARDTLEYWSQKHMAVARGDAVALTNDARRIAADTLVAYTTESNTPPGPAGPRPATTAPPADPMGASGKLQKVEAFGNVSIRTPTDTVTGDRGIYVPETGMARLTGTVRITRGQNQLNGSEANVNMKTGVAQLVAGTTGRVKGLVLPSDPSNQSLGAAAGAAVPGRAKGKTTP